MGVIRILKLWLFLYEFIKIMGILTILFVQRSDPDLLMKIVLTAPGALFPIMTLFILLDANRYKAFIPLYTAGKCISFILMLGWLIVSRQVTMTVGFFSIELYAEMALYNGELLALAVVLLIMIYNKKMTADREEN